ncbi:MAG TPA: YHS domain-containing protein, partial [bacterium]|nr:YHS domain-containing protein [bacterium]
MLDHEHHDETENGPPGLKDPVCGMDVDADSPYHHVHAGQTYYFCNPRCLEKFKADPVAYLEPRDAAGDHAAAGTIYTCPMHPEIEQAGPGPCPICGMALEPKSALEGEADETELKAMQARLWI